MCFFSRLKFCNLTSCLTLFDGFTLSLLVAFNLLRFLISIRILFFFIIRVLLFLFQKISDSFVRIVILLE